MGRKGIVLAGGGSRGAYQIGVWKALRELDAGFSVVTGSSVGALNGILMIQGDYQAAEELWLSLYTGDIVNFPDFPREVDYTRNGWEADVWIPFIKQAMASEGADFAPLEALMHRYVDEKKVRGSGIAFGLVTVEYPSMKPLEVSLEEIPEGKLCDYLAASAACFPAFRSKEIDGSRFIDGGYHDNQPVNLAARLGAEEVLAVSLDGIGLEKKPRNREMSVKIISSYWDLGPFLWFEPELSRRNMKLGYLDAMKLYGRYEGWAYTFDPGSRAELAVGFGQKLVAFYEKSRVRSFEGKMGVLAAEKAAWFRLRRVLSKKRGKLRGNDEFLAACEIAAEYLHVSPLEAFSAESFLRECAACWRRMEEAEEHPSGWQAIRSCLELFYQAEKTEELDGNFWQQAILTPEAMMTAAVLWFCGQ